MQKYNGRCQQQAIDISLCVYCEAYEVFMLAMSISLDRDIHYGPGQLLYPGESSCGLQGENRNI